MKEYSKPKMTVTKFKCGDIMTLSTGGTAVKDYTGSAGENGNLSVVTAGGTETNPFQ